MKKVEIRPNNELFYQPSCIVTVADNNCIYVDYYKCNMDHRNKSVKYGSYSDINATKNKRVAWNAIKSFMLKEGCTDLKTIACKI